MTKEIQYGGEAVLSCSWGFNTNNKTVTWLRTTPHAGEQEIATVEIRKNRENKALKVSLNEKKLKKKVYVVEGPVENNLTIAVVNMTDDDHGLYSCQVNVTINNMKLSVEQETTILRK